MVSVMDIIGVIEILIIAGSLYAIWWYSQPEKEEATSTEDFH